jgi:hypothetical protein
MLRVDTAPLGAVGARPPKALLQPQASTTSNATPHGGIEPQAGDAVLQSRHDVSVAADGAIDHATASPALGARLDPAPGNEAGHGRGRARSDRARIRDRMSSR